MMTPVELWRRIDNSSGLRSNDIGYTVCHGSAALRNGCDLFLAVVIQKQRSIRPAIQIRSRARVSVCLSGLLVGLSGKVCLVLPNKASSG
jgi:hypothetical protein